jgi:hypothetical protein
MTQDETRGIVLVGTLRFGPMDQYLLLSSGLDHEEALLGGVDLGDCVDVTPTGWGDGLYPVSEQRDQHGALSRITVLFVGGMC